MNSYELSRNFIDYSFENPEKIKPIHYAIFFFTIEHCNRLGWKEKFGLPSQMVMEAIGVKNWRTYSAGLNDLVDFGFIKMIEISKNQYSSNIVAIVNFTKADTKALDKALSNHLQKQSTKQGQSIVSIDKQLNNKTINNKTIEHSNFKKLLLSELKNSDDVIKKENEKNKNFSEYLEIAVAFNDLFILNVKEANASTKNLERARGEVVNDIKLMFEVDNYTKEQMQKVYKFLQGNDFWKKNILSIKTLRKQFNKLIIQSNDKGNKNNRPSINIDDLTEAVDRHFRKD